MIEIIWTIGFLILTLWSIAHSLLGRDKDPYKSQSKLLGVLVYNLIFFLFWALLFIVWQENLTADYAAVLQAIFVIYTILITAGNFLVFFSVGLLLLWILMTSFFRGRK